VRLLLELRTFCCCARKKCWLFNGGYRHLLQRCHKHMWLTGRGSGCRQIATLHLYIAIWHATLCLHQTSSTIKQQLHPNFGALLTILSLCRSQIFCLVQPVYLCLTAAIRVRSFHLHATHEFLQFCIFLLENLDYCTVIQYDGAGTPLLLPVLTSAKQAFNAMQSTSHFATIHSIIKWHACMNRASMN